jgi:hypothetical protein
MIKPRGSRSQGWKTFLLNHAGGIASIDLFVARTSNDEREGVTDRNSKGRTIALPEARLAR